MTEQVVATEATVARESSVGAARRAELAIWLRGLRSFFDVSNQPFTEAEQEAVLSRNWSNEIQIVHSALLTSSAIALQLDASTSPEGMLAERGNSIGHAPFARGASHDDSFTGNNTDNHHRPPILLAESLYDISIICESLLLTPGVSFSAWSAVGRLLARELDRSNSAREIVFEDDRVSSRALQPELTALIRNTIGPSALSSDILIIFSEMGRLLERLRLIAGFIRRDHPLKQTLPIFSSIYEDSRALLDFIQTRALHAEGLEETVLNALDSTHYIISLELRKAFRLELAGVSALRQSAQILLKIDAAHGLLRTCFQQSTISLAHLFDPDLKGADLFTSIQIDLEQSIILRRDLFMLLQLVRRAQATESKTLSSSPFGSFRDVSLRFLKYRDREDYDKFIEKISAARGADELARILHSFEAYLETLFGCINMRSVLADHPFEASNPDLGMI